MRPYWVLARLRNVHAYPSPWTRPRTVRPNVHTRSSSNRTPVRFPLKPVPPLTFTTEHLFDSVHTTSTNASIRSLRRRGNTCSTSPEYIIIHSESSLRNQAFEVTGQKSQKTIAPPRFRADLNHLTSQPRSGTMDTWKTCGSLEGSRQLHHDEDWTFEARSGNDWCYLGNKPAPYKRKGPVMNEVTRGPCYPEPTSATFTSPDGTTEYLSISEASDRIMRVLLAESIDRWLSYEMQSVVDSLAWDLSSGHTIRHEGWCVVPVWEN